MGVEEDRWLPRTPKPEDTSYHQLEQARFRGQLIFKLEKATKGRGSHP
jgi:hypothetical protein